MKSLLLIFAITLFVIPLSGQSNSTDTLDTKNSSWSLDSFNNNTFTFYEELEIISNDGRKIKTKTS